MSATSLALACDLDAGDLVGKVLADRLRRRRRVRGPVGHRVDGRAAHPLQADCVGMDGYEEIGLVLTGDAHALVEPKEDDLGRASSGRRSGPVSSSAVFELQSERERDRLFQRAARALRPAVDAAMAGVDDDGEGTRALAARTASAGRPSASPGWSPSFRSVRRALPRTAPRCRSISTTSAMAGRGFVRQKIDLLDHERPVRLRIRRERMRRACHIAMSVTMPPGLGRVGYVEARAGRSSTSR